MTTCILSHFCDVFFSKTVIVVESNLGSLDGATLYKPRLVFGCDGWRRVLGHLHVADAVVGVQTNAASVASLGSEQLCHGVLASPKKKQLCLGFVC